MDIREFTTYSENSPITGYGVWIVLDQGNNRTQLLHPFLLTELVVTEYEFKTGSGETLWPKNSSGVPFNASKFLQTFKNKIAFFLENGRPFNIHLVAKALSFFEETTIEEAMSFIGTLSKESEPGESTSRLSNKAQRVYRIREEADLLKIKAPRQKAIIEALKSGPASIYQIISLVDGKLKSKSDLNRVVTYFVGKLTSQGILEIVT